MKKILVMMALLVSSQAMAVGITLSPVYTVVSAVRSVLETVVSPFATTSAGISEGLNAEQLRAVKDQAIAYLAEGEQSQILKIAMTEVRKNVPQLKQATDIEIAAQIIAASR